MHILFIGYGKTSQRVAKPLFDLGHHISTISSTTKTDPYATHYAQDIHTLDLSNLPSIDWVYVLLSPQQTGVEGYKNVYLDSVKPIVSALQKHPIQRIVVVSSTRVYGEDQGGVIDDNSLLQPLDEQGRILQQMEQAYLETYPNRCTIIRPTGIYGTSVTRMKRLAENYKTYPCVHWSNRIHIDDLANFLVYLMQIEHVKESYIVSNSQPVPLHEVLQWFQQQLDLVPLTLESERITGKKVYATHLQHSGFMLQHQDAFADYLTLLEK